MEKQLPRAFIKRIKNQLGDEFEDFMQAMSEDAVVSVRVNPNKKTTDFEQYERVPWCKYGYYLEKNPGFVFDPLIHAGSYYVQEASSMVFHHAIDFQKAKKYLDLCAAPGGKSTLLESLIDPDSIVFSNELVNKRAKVLEENLIKWGSDNFVITSNKASDYRHFAAYFDVVLVDAPCSGEGMFRKNQVAIRQWNETRAFKCSVDQRDILDDAILLVKNGGLLIYSTCTYSLEENEQIVHWFYQKYHSVLEAASLQLADETNIIRQQISHFDNSEQDVYKCFPHKIKGEGMFISVFRVKGNAHSGLGTKKKSIKSNLPKSLFDNILDFVDYDPDKHQIIHMHDKIYLIPKSYSEEIQLAAEKLNVLSAGVELGSVNFKTGKFIPSHKLALSRVVKKSFPGVEMSKEDALRYLKKEALKDVAASDFPPGWLLAKYRSHALGWLKSSNGRMNNLYPKEWKIRKELPDIIVDF